jgi:O-antigen ligase
VLALLALGAIVRPPAALAAVLCIYGLKQWGQSTNSFLAAHPPLTNVAVGVLVLVALGMAMIRGRCIFCKIPRITWAVITLFLYSFVSLMWTPRPDIARPLWVESAPYLVTFVVLVPLVIRDARDLRVALSWLLVVGGALVYILLVFGNWGLRGLSLGPHSVDAETNPLALAGLGGSVAAAAMLFRPARSSLLMWIIRLGLVGGGLLLIVRSESRGQLVALLAAIVLMLPFSVRIGSIRGVIAAAVGIAVVAFSLIFAFSHFSAGKEDAQRWSSRNNTADAAVRMEYVTKLLSASSASAGTFLFGLGNSASWDPQINGIYPHNVALEALGEEGVVGFVLYAGITLGALGALLGALRTAQQADRGLVAAVGGVFLFFLLISLKQGNMISSVEYFMFAILLARLRNGLEVADAPRPQIAAVAVPAGPLYPNLLR